MEIKSTNNNSIIADTIIKLKKIAKSIFDTPWIYLILFCISSALGYFIYLDNTWYHIITPILAIVFLLIVTNGDIADHPTGLAMTLLLANLLVSVISWANIPIETKSDKMSLSEYVVKVDKDVMNTVFIDFREPFETGVNLNFKDSKWDKLILDKNSLKDFIFTAEKTCEKFRTGTIQCGVKLLVSHKFEEKVLISTTLKKSVYPKKIVFESKEQSNEDK